MSNQETNNTPATTTPISHANIVAKRVRASVQDGTLHLPADYSAENALKSAWFTLQSVKTRSGQPVLTACTAASIQNALFAMVVFALNPAKKQCDFIAYGNQLVCQPTAEGDVSIVQRIRPGVEVYADVVYEKDEFDYENAHGKIFVTKHRQTLDNIRADQIRAVFAGSRDPETGEDFGAILMSMEQVRMAWTKSQNYSPDNPNCEHNKFPDQFAIRTAKRRFCKPIIRNSDDRQLREALQQQDEITVLSGVDEAEAALANCEILDFEEPAAPALEETQTEAVPAQQEEPEPVQQRRF